ncbi:MAG: lysophospholipid acyltransferase family protein [Anaerolineae bacterium]
MTDSAPRKTNRVAFYTSHLAYRFLWWVFYTLIRIAYRYRPSPHKDFPESGPTIVAVNHLHLTDPAAVSPLLPRQTVTLAAGKWRRSFVVDAILKIAGVIYVRRGEIDREALRQCLHVLGQGGVLAIAPEGTRSRTGAMQRAKAGIAYLALRTNAVIVPVAISGTERLRDWLRLKRPTLRVVMGAPFRLPKPEGKPSAAELQRLADLIMIRLGLDLPESYRGYYADQIAAVESGESDILDVLEPVTA